MLKFPPQKIMVPLDMSEPALKAYALAKNWADAFGSSIEIVRVNALPPLEAAPFYYNYPPPDHKAQLEEMRLHVGPQPHIRIAEGDPPETILRLAKTTKPDVIVMGTHGRKGLERVLLGSAAEYMVRHSSVPVVTVHSLPKGISQVLAPVNFTLYSEHGFAYAALVASALKLSLKILHVADPKDRWFNPDWHLKDLVSQLPDALRSACEIATETVRGESTKSILREAGAHSLIVMVSHRRGLLEDAWKGTTAEQVLRQAKCPVVSIPAPEDVKPDFSTLAAHSHRKP